MKKHIRYSGLQPQYFPRLHYFARILNADVLMIRDDAQYVRKHKYPDGKNGKSYQAHSPIKQSFGTQLLAVPVKHTENRFLPIQKTPLSFDEDWVTNHLMTLKIAYSKAKNFSVVFPVIERLLKKGHKTIGELNTATLFWGILTLLGDASPENVAIERVNSVLKKQNTFRLKEIRRGSESKSLSSGKTMTANEKIIALCQEVGASEDYCGGTSVAAYVDTKLFKDAGITLTVQEWVCQEYPQLFMSQQGFISNLSILDLLFNSEKEHATKIIHGR